MLVLAAMICWIYSDVKYIIVTLQMVGLCAMYGIVIVDVNSSFLICLWIVSWALYGDSAGFILNSFIESNNSRTIKLTCACTYN